MIRNIFRIACCLLCFCITVPAIVALAPELDLESCQDDLDNLRKRASDVSEAAEGARSKFEDFDDCRRDPETYDHLGDDCRTYRADYMAALDDLESAMDDVDARIHSVQDSCGYQFTVNRMSSLQAAQQRLCTSYTRLLRTGMPPDTLLQMCTARMNADWCKQCIGLK